MRVRPSHKEVAFNKKNVYWIAAVHLLALALCVPFFSWRALIVFCILHVSVMLLGVTFCFHRLLSHRSFAVPRWIANLTAILGTLTCQGGPIAWVGQHRVHHAFSDTDLDPHNIHRGFWYSHIGFLIWRRKDLDVLSEVSHYCPDISKDPFYLWLDHNMILIQFLLGFALFGLGGLTFSGGHVGFSLFLATSCVVWGVLVRLVTGYHSTWLVNSATHMWGSRPYEIQSHDRSSNNWVVGLLAFGEGWHNNHHSQPRAALYGWRWWQFDATWQVIKLLRMLGLAKNIKMPVFCLESKETQDIEDAEEVEVKNADETLDKKCHQC